MSDAHVHDCMVVCKTCGGDATEATEAVIADLRARLAAARDALEWTESLARALRAIAFADNGDAGNLARLALAASPGTEGVR